MQHSNPALRPSLELLRPAPLRCGEEKGHSKQCGRKNAARPQERVGLAGTYGAEGRPGSPSPPAPSRPRRTTGEHPSLPPIRLASATPWARQRLDLGAFWLSPSKFKFNSYSFRPYSVVPFAKSILQNGEVNQILPFQLLSCTATLQSKPYNLW